MLAGTAAINNTKNLDAHPIGLCVVETPEIQRNSRGEFYMEEPKAQQDNRLFKERHIAYLIFGYSKIRGIETSDGFVSAGYSSERRIGQVFQAERKGPPLQRLARRFNVPQRRQGSSRTTGTQRKSQRKSVKATERMQAMTEDMEIVLNGPRKASVREEIRAPSRARFGFIFSNSCFILICFEHSPCATSTTNTMSWQKKCNVRNEDKVSSRTSDTQRESQRKSSRQRKDTGTQGVIVLSSGESEIYTLVKGASAGLGATSMFKDQGVDIS